MKKEQEEEHADESDRDKADSCVWYRAGRWF